MHYKGSYNAQSRVSGAEVARFLVVTFVIGAAAQLAAVRFGLSKGSGWLLVAMWAPTAGVLASGRQGRRLAWTALRRSGGRWLPLGVVVGLAPAVVQATVLALTRRGHWDVERFPLRADGSGVASVHRVAMALGVGDQSWLLFAGNLALSLALGSLVTAVIGGVGEEIGWRGLLQPALETRAGRHVATLLVAAVWAYWHLPGNLNGYNDPRHPWVNALVLFPLMVVAMSYSLATLRRRSGSVWPAALAHGANNTIGTFLVVADSWWIDQVTALVSYGAVALVVVLLAGRQTASAARATAELPAH